MKRCSKTLANVDADRETALHEIDELEVRLANVNSSSSKKRGGDNKDANATKITAIQQVKNLRGELTMKEDLIKDLDERISLEHDKLKMLGNELKNLAPASMTNVSHTMQNSAVSRGRTHRN